METDNKLREALKKIRNDVLDMVVNHKSDDPSYAYGLCISIGRACDMALAEPVRNCEVGTAMEQGELFSAYCRAHKHPESECIPCPLFGQTGGYCELAWAQMPYEEGVPNAE